MHKLFFPLALLIGTKLLAQSYCYTTEKQNEWFAKHPEFKANYEKHQKESAELDQALYKNNYTMAGRSATAGNYTVPVVFHILHLGTGENISDAQVIDAVNILTRDFNCANTDTSDVVHSFKHLIGNPQFNFKLATKDPNGNCTNGIIRHYDVNTDWQGNYSDYAYTWPPSRYLNVYVVRSMGGGAAGYTYLPGSGIPSSMDAIVILSNYVGSIGSGNAYTSRALTHEVGHWFNLQHTWGGTNQPEVACGDDGVSDTPITKGYTVCNLATPDICNPGIIENVQNYMEYAYCQRMYTIGQTSRMVAAMNSTVNSRNNVSTPGNLATTGITSPGTGCTPSLQIAALPSFTICAGRSLNLASFTCVAAPTSYSWSANNGASIASPTSPATTIMFPNAGVTSISCLVANANGSDSKTITVTVTNGTTQFTTTAHEGFEGSTVAPPANWTVINPTTPNDKWEPITPVGSEGVVCMYVPGENLSANAVEILESPSYDFKHNPGCQFSFKYAYAMKSAGNKDLFKVQASKDCGGSWTDVWVPTNTSLAQGSGGTTSTLYLPSGNEWKMKILTQQPQFFPFTSEEHVNLRFYFQEDVGGTGHGNRFYLDEVNFETALGVNQLTQAIGLNVYPNPSSADFVLSFELADAAKIRYQVISISGAVLLSQEEKTYTEGAHALSINQNSELAPGVYFINLQVNGVNMSRKIIVQ